MALDFDVAVELFQQLSGDRTSHIPGFSLGMPFPSEDLRIEIISDNKVLRPIE